MTTLILLSLTLLAVALVLLNKQDATEQACYHRLLPAEDGCVHEVEPQPTYALVDEDQYGFGMEHWDKPTHVDALGYTVHGCPTCGNDTIGWNATSFCCTGCNIVALK